MRTGRTAQRLKADMTESSKSVRLVVSGRVQGVGYRHWFAGEASARELRGWVRNRSDGTVEALLAGSLRAVDSMIEACRSGPPDAAVASVEVFQPDAAALSSVQQTMGFTTRATLRD